MADIGTGKAVARDKFKSRQQRRAADKRTRDRTQRHKAKLDETGDEVANDGTFAKTSKAKTGKAAPGIGGSARYKTSRKAARKVRDRKRIAGLPTNAARYAEPNDDSDANTNVTSNAHTLEEHIELRSARRRAQEQRRLLRHGEFDLADARAGERALELDDELELDGDGTGDSGGAFVRSNAAVVADGETLRVTNSQRRSRPQWVPVVHHQESEKMARDALSYDPFVCVDIGSLGSVLCDPGSWESVFRVDELNENMWPNECLRELLGRAFTSHTTFEDDDVAQSPAHEEKEVRIHTETQVHQATDVAEVETGAKVEVEVKVEDDTVEVRKALATASPPKAGVVDRTTAQDEDFFNELLVEKSTIPSRSPVLSPSDEPVKLQVSTSSTVPRTSTPKVEEEELEDWLDSLL